MSKKKVLTSQTRKSVLPRTRMLNCLLQRQQLPPDAGVRHHNNALHETQNIDFKSAGNNQ